MLLVLAIFGGAVLFGCVILWTLRAGPGQIARDVPGVSDFSAAEAAEVEALRSAHVDQPANPYRSPVGPPVGADHLRRGRRITGLILFSLGGLLAARVLWLVVFYWSVMGEESQQRFVGLLWLAIEVLAGGAWLAFRSSPAAWVFTAGVVLALLTAFI
ncbi:MAG TPA: hypothetical protein VHY20_13330 [Pirellulales bacterium]|jgi:hypothetical protein|nr:hypothetical protein [Pirellulales bacterium]